MIKHTLKTLFGDIVSYEREDQSEQLMNSLVQICKLKEDINDLESTVERLRESIEYWRSAYHKQYDATQLTATRLNRAQQRYDELKQAIQSALHNR